MWKNEQLECRTLIHENSTFLCLCIVRRPTTYVLRMFTPFKAFVWTPICFFIGSSIHRDVAVFHFHIHIHVFLWRLTCSACSHTPFNIMIMAINVEPDSRTSSSMVAPSCADPEGVWTSAPPPPWKITKI